MAVDDDDFSIPTVVQEVLFGFVFVFVGRCVGLCLLLLLLLLIANLTHDLVTTVLLPLQLLSCEIEWKETTTIAVVVLGSHDTNKRIM
jgi:hypothetical protein